MLAIEAALAAKLLMLNLQIGGHPVFKRNGAVPCVVFSQLSTYRQLMSRTASSGQPITFDLKNTDAGAVTVYGVWFGKTPAIKA